MLWTSIYIIRYLPFDFIIGTPARNTVPLPLVAQLEMPPNPNLNSLLVKLKLSPLSP